MDLYRVRERSGPNYRKIRAFPDCILDEKLTPRADRTNINSKGGMMETKRKSSFKRVGVAILAVVFLIGALVYFIRSDVSIETEESIKTQADIKTSDKPELHSELTKLGQLRDNGLITDEEFDKKNEELIEQY